VHGPVVEQRQDGAADISAADAMAPVAATAAPAAAHLVPPISMAASLSLHLAFSFRSIMN
jgi:hypothetical protein